MILILMNPVQDDKVITLPMKDTGTPSGLQFGQTDRYGECPESQVLRRLANGLQGNPVNHAAALLGKEVKGIFLSIMLADHTETRRTALHGVMLVGHPEPHGATSCCSLT